MTSQGPSRRHTNLNRRTFLQSAGAGASISLAGCTGLLDDSLSSYEVDQRDFDPQIPPYDTTYPDSETISMFRGGLRRLGYYPGETVPDDVSINWRMPINYIGHNAAKASPVPTPDGETIVIPADTGRIHAVSPKGELEWSVQTRATRQGIHASPVIVDDTIYIGGYDGANRGRDAAMYAYDVDTGEQLWRNDNLGGAVAIGSSAGYWNGYLYVVVEYRHPEESGALWVFDAETGETLWSDDRIVDMPHSTVAIDPASERLLTGSNDGVLYCWEFPSLEFEWGFETDGAIKGPIATYDGGAFVGSWDEHFYRVSLDDGTEDWSYETDGIVMSAPAVDPETGIVYVGSDDRHVYALDTETGEELWSTNLHGRVMSALTVTADAVLAGTNAAELCCLEKGSGELRWWVETEGQVTSAARPHDGRILFAERGVISGYWDDDEPDETEVPGHAYCLVEA